ncbi:phage late control D family protein [Dyella sp. M7H15-1]|uniref:phage late control D family protein n=1 Tax=Dyella sp. M7H15-1 TaxID=2501295 RepID=UPI001004F8CE|nr:contractile injection system protein, VgrG/Pvc8 family [Dyella sp. M7H15-1]QAU22900.1 phage late control D family protein [Dyella sp. M7H15-1]
MGLMPAFRVTANGQDITDTIRARFVSLSLNDATGVEGDSLELVLDDSQPAWPVRIPPTGAELEVWLGYDDTVRRMGLYVCDGVTLRGWPGEMVLQAHAAPWDGTPKGKSDLQSQKTRSWPDNTTLGDMVTLMAGEHGLESAVSPSLAEVKLPHTDQTDESDINLLLRLAKRYDAIAKPAGGRLIFAKRGESKSVTGIELPRIVLTPGDIDQWEMSQTTRESPGTVVAYYHLTRAAERHQVSAGSGDPVTRIRIHFSDADAAAAAVRAELARRARREIRFSIHDMAGRPDLTGEAMLVLQGWREDVAGEWLVSHVRHSLDTRGYRCGVEAERPNSNQEVAGLINVEVRDVVVGPEAGYAAA